MADLKQEGFFQQMKGRLRSAWGELTDDDIDKAGGNMDRLVGVIKQKTGQSEDAIRGRLQSMRDGDSESTTRTRRD